MQENILRKILKKKILIILFTLILTENISANQKWIIDKNISNITFEVPVLFTTNVKGEFKDIQGFVEIDLENYINNKAVLSVKIESLDVNYKKYRDLILSNIFFDSNNFPFAVLDTKKFSYKDEEELKLNIELTIKGLSKILETKIKIKKYTNDLVQILGDLELSRNEFNIGIGNWSNTTILKDTIKIKSNIFLIRE